MNMILNEDDRISILLNENFEYCNELAKRINLLVDVVESLGKRIQELEKQKNE